MGNSQIRGVAAHSEAYKNPTIATKELGQTC